MVGPDEAIVDSFQGQRPKPNSDADLLALLVAGGLVGGPPNDFAGTAADPTSSTDSSEGWARGSRIHASSGKVWECLSAAINAAVWACLNGPVPHPSSGDAAVLLDPTDDGGQLWLTHAAPTVTVPEDVLRPGFTCEVIAEGASTVITFAGAGSMVVQRPPSFTLSTGERWASVTVTVRDATNAIVRGFLA